MKSTNTHTTIKAIIKAVIFSACIVGIAKNKKPESFKRVEAE